MYRAAAVACFAAGLWILAGPGWALLAMGALLWVLEPRGSKEPARWGEAVTWLRGLAVQAQEMPRRVTAVTSMAAGVVGVPAGVMLLYGAGAAIVTAGAALIGVSLLTGWNA